MLLASLLVLSIVVLTGVTVFAEEEEGDLVAVQAEEAPAEVSFKSGYENLPEDATTGERFLYGIKVAGIGMMMVFLVLIIIMAVLYCFQAVAAVKAKKPAPTAKAAPAAPVKAAASGEADEETVVAVATAAIAAARGQSDCAFKVVSITKIQ